MIQSPPVSHAMNIVVIVFKLGGRELRLASLEGDDGLRHTWPGALFSCELSKSGTLGRALLRTGSSKAGGIWDVTECEQKGSEGRDGQHSDINEVKAQI